MRNFEDYFEAIRRGFRQVEAQNGVIYVQAAQLADTGMVRHGFTSRIGGISQAPYEGLNLSWNRTNSVEETRRNVAIACEAMEIDPDDLVVVNGVHGVNVHVVNAADRGWGYHYLYQGSGQPTFDGLVTNDPAVCLNTVHADCTPVFLLDPVKRAIGLCHSGWRGTVIGMARNTIAAMEQAYGTRPEDLIVAVGPNIGKCCFQVSQDVVDAIQAAYPRHIQFYTPDAGIAGKYHADLLRLTAYDLYQKGVRRENITIADLCTCCREDLFYSYRRGGPNRGAMNSFLQLIQ